MGDLKWKCVWKWCLAAMGLGEPIVCTSAVEYMRYANEWLRCATSFVAEVQVWTETFALHTIENGWLVEEFRRNTHRIVLFKKKMILVMS